MASVKGYALVVSALIFCPCHLPIVAAVFAGSMLGSAIAEHYGLLFPLMAGYFIGALFLGLRLMTRTEQQTPCDSCETGAQPTATGFERGSTSLAGAGTTSREPG